MGFLSESITDDWSWWTTVSETVPNSDVRRDGLSSSEWLLKKKKKEKYKLKTEGANLGQILTCVSYKFNEVKNYT